MADFEKIGGVTLDEISSMVGAQSTAIDDAGTDLITRFSRRVVQLLEARSKHEAKSFCAFVLLQTSSTPNIPNLVHMPMVGMGHNPVTGAIWIVSHSLNQHSWKVECDFKDQSELFSTINTLGLNKSATVIVDWRSGEPKAMILPSGASGEESMPLHFEDSPISPEVLKSTLDAIYDDNFRTPLVANVTHQRKVWKDSGKGWPQSRPEEVIHGRLENALKRAFPKHGTKSEETTKLGRADLSIFKRVTSPAGHPTIRTDWLLELKALCDHTSKGTKKPANAWSAAVTEGITQIKAYASLIYPIQKALCCFDMREVAHDDEKCFAHVTTEASGLNIHLWRWFLFRSSSAARDAEFGGTT